MQLASSLLLFDTLVVVWWYAHLTNKLATTASKQLKFEQARWLIQNKPIVVLDVHRWQDARGNEAAKYVVRNEAPGVAINVYFVEPADRGWKPSAFGAIAPGASVDLVANAVDTPIRDRKGTKPSRIVVAESIATRTTQQWIVTLNVLDKYGDVHHRFVEFDHRKGITWQTALNEMIGEWDRQMREMRDALG